MRRNPKGDWTIDDVGVVCRGHGVQLEPPTRGSHFTVSHPLMEAIVTIPRARRIKGPYIKQLIEFIEKAVEAEALAEAEAERQRVEVEEEKTLEEAQAAVDAEDKGNAS